MSITLTDLAAELVTTPETVAAFDQSRTWPTDLSDVVLDDEDAQGIREGWAMALEQEADRA